MTAPLTCRVLPFQTADGPANMALDHALLDAVDADPSAAVFRIYGWTQPTLSLGYFQRLDDARSDPRWAGVPIVRRPSGGGALLHDHEWTYAFILPRMHPLAARPSALYRAVHAALIERMKAEGIPAMRRGDAPPAPGRPFLCFLDRDAEDVLVGGAKVVGSAQRRRPSAVLQHGSMLLAKSRFTPELPGLADLDGVPPDARSILDDLPEALGLIPRPDGLDRVEEAAAGRLEREVYASSGWTARR